MQGLQDRIAYRFRDEELLAVALTHRSLVNTASNQRLEFLGDAVLGAVVAKILYDTYPGEQEGSLARRHAALVRGETLTQVARDIGIGDALRIGMSETQSNGRDNASNLEDALEALIGALYLDGGMSAVEQFITPRWTALAQKSIAPPKDAKTTLQEWAQARGLAIPVYRIAGTAGPAHAPLFTIEVSITGHPPAQAQALSKRLAEQTAAEKLLKELEKTP